MTRLTDVVKLAVLSPLWLLQLFRVDAISSFTDTRLFKKKFENYAPFRRHRVMVKALITALSKRDTPLEILDVGCGPGAFLGRLSLSELSIGKMWGVDFMSEEESRDVYRAKSDCYNRNSNRQELPDAPDFEFRQLDLERDGLKGFADDSMDVIVCSDVLEHLGNTSLVLSEIRRCLKPDGVFVFSVPNPTNLLDRLHYLLTGESRRYPVEGPGLEFFHVSLFTPNILRNLLRRAGLPLLLLRGDSIVIPPLISVFEVKGLFLSHSIIGVATKSAEGEATCK